MRKKQGITIAALIIAIVGLSIGFAAFSNTLNISGSASVNPSENTFNVVFSSSSNSVATTSVSPTKDPLSLTTTNATINGRSLSNLSAEFTAPGQSVTYETNLYVYNAGQLQAQLTGITFNNATGGGAYKKCAAIPQQNESATATESLVTAACEGISIKVTVGTADDVTPTTTGDLAALNYQMLGVGASLPVSVTISYTGDNYVDGPMEVSFGDIEISATSAIDPTQEVDPYNYWKESGLTSTNVVFNSPYTYNDKDNVTRSVVLYKTGAFTDANGTELTPEQTAYYYDNGYVIVGTDYFAVNGGGQNYSLYVFDSPSTMKYYSLNSDNLSGVEFSRSGIEGKYESLGYSPVTYTVSQ